MIDLSKYTRSLLGIRLSTAQLNSLDTFEKELLKWNERINLTAIRDPEQIRIKHFLDSLSCISVMRDIPMEKVIDIGTGAGFPGLPLKILCPEMELTLVESVAKKADFCHHVIRTLGLEKVQVIQARAETVGQMPGHRQKYDWATARAVAIMPVLVEYLLPLVRVGGAALAMKGETAPAETQDADHATRLLGGHLKKLTPIELPSVAEERYLVVIDKVAATPDKYPRRVGVPAKHPLRSSNKM
jgi:16S rRNA (guanine527-N7)-methyltransferase